jgi:predicted lactoylglutathione lyase
MLGYISLGTNDMDKATAFYDQLTALVGAKRVWDDETFVAWSNASTGGISVTKPYNGEPATVGNGVMAAIAAPDRATVNKIYEKAISLGGTDEGAPGLRGGDDSTFYAAYFRDLDGNKLNAFYMGPA